MHTRSSIVFSVNCARDRLLKRDIFVAEVSQASTTPACRVLDIVKVMLHKMSYYK